MDYSLHQFSLFTMPWHDYLSASLLLPKPERAFTLVTFIITAYFLSSNLYVKMVRERTFKLLTDEDYAKAFKTLKLNSDENNTIRHAIIQPIINNYAGKSIDMMSIGAGDGWLEDEIIRNPNLNINSILAIEPNHEHAEKLKEKAAKWESTNSIIDISCFDETYETSMRFDVILMVHSIYYQKFPIKAISRAKSFLRRGGVLIIAIVGKNGGHQLAARLYEQMDNVPAFYNDHLLSSGWLVNHLTNNSIRFHLQTFNCSHDVTDFIKRKETPTCNDTITFFLNTKYESLDTYLQDEVYNMVQERVTISKDKRHLFPEDHDFIYIESV